MIDCSLSGIKLKRTLCLNYAAAARIKNPIKLCCKWPRHTECYQYLGMQFYFKAVESDRYSDRTRPYPRAYNNQNQK